MIYWDLYILKKLNLIEENEKLKKEKLKKEYTKKEIVITIIIFTFNNSSFGFFDSLLSLLSNIKFKALLININTSNKIFIIS